MRRSVLGLVGLLLLAGPAAAEERAVLQEEMVITAKRFAEDAARTGATVTVIDRETLEARQVRRADEAIAAVPGVFVATAGPPGSSSSVFLRGAASNQTMVLVDGIRVNDPTVGGQFNFFDLGIENFERVEVLRGAASTVYGSDAIGGVVSFVTRMGRGAPAVRVTSEGGSYGYERALASFSGEAGAFDFATAVSRTRYRNDLPHDAFLADTFAGQVGFELLDGLRVSAVGRLVDSEAEDPWAFPFGARIEEDDNTERQRNTALGGIAVEHEVSDTFRWRVTASLFDVNSLLVDGGDARGAPVELRSRAEARVRTVSALSEVRPEVAVEWLDLEVLLGIDYEDETSENRVTTAFGASPDLEETVRNRAAWLVAQATVDDRVTVSGGLRRDRNSYFGWETTGSASAVVSIPETGTRVRANYGEGFRAPKPVEFADPYVGNPDLAPERSRSIDAGVEQDLLDGACSLSATWFQLATRDLIAYDATTFRLENLHRARVRGVELAGDVTPVEGLTASASLTLMEPRNLSAGPGEERRLPGRPRRFGGGDLVYRGTGFTAGLHVVASGDFPAAGRVTPDGVRRDHPGRKLLVALRGAVEVLPGVTATARVENLLDDTWYDSDAAPDGLGRGVYVGLVVDF